MTRVREKPPANRRLCVHEAAQQLRNVRTGMKRLYMAPADSNFDDLLDALRKAD